MFSFSRVIHACVRQIVLDKPGNRLDSSLEEAENLEIGPCSLPGYGQGLVFSNAYFENVHFQYPFLHEPTFRQWERNAHGFGLEAATPVELFFVNMVCRK